MTAPTPTPGSRSCPSRPGESREPPISAAPTATSREREREREREGVRVLAEGRWPEAGDGEPPVLPGFVYSGFAPLVAAAAERCLRRRHGAPPAAVSRTAVVLVSAGGDRASAKHVRSTVAAGGRVGPLFFFQSVPNSVAGHVAARWGLDGPVVCLSPTGDPWADGAAEVELLLYDGDADEALLVLMEEAPDGTPTGAVAVLLGGGTRQ